MPEERIYVVPLSKAREAPRYARSKRAVALLKNFVKKHVKYEKIFIDPKLNEMIWGRGARKPPTRVRIKVVKEDDGTVKVFSAE